MGKRECEKETWVEGHKITGTNTNRQRNRYKKVRDKPCKHPLRIIKNTEISYQNRDIYRPIHIHSFRNVPYILFFINTVS